MKEEIKQHKHCKKCGEVIKECEYPYYRGEELEAYQLRTCKFCLIRTGIEKESIKPPSSQD